MANAVLENEKDYHENLKLDSLDNYYKQFLCYTELTGDSIVFINAFRYFFNRSLPNDETHPNDWHYYLEMVDDGGDFYWNVKINFSKKKYYDFNVNGEA